MNPLIERSLTRRADRLAGLFEPATVVLWETRPRETADPDPKPINAAMHYRAADGPAPAESGVRS